MHAEEHFGPCYSTRTQGRPSVWQARHQRSWPWIFFLRMDGGVIIDFAFDLFLLFA
ncbi:hypothetical protein BAE44_0007032 [Dichanthelium oligosanthes]|uniref:Uncharacterized protein n=1 Tax=Dichanthelium oligosanthes TaxID=888268 RepID=A0A1E5W3H5_9POAL|nr:hypothetical protein BAE44_0007032 [Dichanthelium oligosanthes]